MSKETCISLAEEYIVSESDQNDAIHKAVLDIAEVPAIEVIVEVGAILSGKMFS